MEMQLEGALEFGAERALEVQRGEEARDFPLVLNGDQLVIGTCDGGRQRLSQAGVSLRQAHTLDERTIASCIRFAAGLCEMDRAPLDQRVERRRRLQRRLAPGG